MRTYAALEEEYTAKLASLYDAAESREIFGLAVEATAGLDFTRLVMERYSTANDETEQCLLNTLNRLLSGEPIQYILGHAWFHGHRFRVSPAVLIPRRETEELVDLVIRENKGRTCRLLDIGTGSGCIAISLKLALPSWDISAADISQDALALARTNANSLGASVNFLELDITDHLTWEQLPVQDIIVSNPPYIPLSEAGTMKPLVTKNEPSLALFVPDNDPLKFYRIITQFAENKLAPGGRIYAEAHEQYAGEVLRLFGETPGLGGSRIIEDMQGKQRMVYTQKQADGFTQ